ncbi:hypothetical protein [Natronorubrum thiooxidans]|uniref:Uncharacterized protein n=1 Tax=Natronorubrum thiooxidans TaxID=308853 RepID=A0A1N7ETI0_9EURY|nr:hypothetical protein [Natronorubrum thiooxidans]SIR91324.1 hypothetical protein SAMN05421752_10538 [Natronorubrum thiooxidans]
MATTESTDPTDTDATDQTDVPVYLPGTPTIGFTSRLKQLFETLGR